MDKRTTIKMAKQNGKKNNKYNGQTKRIKGQQIQWQNKRIKGQPIQWPNQKDKRTTNTIAKPKG
jgi:16S rRNA G527 N7-methylase RsmG